MAMPDSTGASPVAPPEPLPYDVVQALYDRRTLAAHEVMGDRWQRFRAAKEELLELPPGSREWHVAAERAYRLGLRSTHAYYVWTRGHTAAVLGQREARVADLRIRLRHELQRR